MLTFINEERAKDDNKSSSPSAPICTKKTKVSTTNKDAGWLNKDEKEDNFALIPYSL